MIDLDHLKQLVSEVDGNVLSLYLHVDPGYQENQADIPAWQIWLKNALRDIENGLADEEKPRWQAIQKRLDDYLTGYQPGGKTLVLILGEDIEHIHELPVALDNAASYGEPLLVPLLWAIDEYERYLIVLVDKEQARFISAYLGYAFTDGQMTIDIDDYDFRQKTLMPASDGSRALREGSNRDRFEDTLEAHHRRFYKQIADETRRLAEEIDTDRIVLGGSEQAAHALQEELHESVAKLVIGILSIPMATRDSDVAEHIRQKAEAFERHNEMQLVEDVIGLARSEGRGALGLKDVQRALDMQQVELLILPFPMEDEALAKELSLKALEANSHVELVHGDAAERLRQEGDVAARLYYAIAEG